MEYISIKSQKRPKSSNEKLNAELTGPNHFLSISAIDEIGLSSCIKRHRLADYSKDQGPSICCTQETYPTNKYTQKLEVKGWKNYPKLMERNSKLI